MQETDGSNIFSAYSRSRSARMSPGVSEVLRQYRTASVIPMGPFDRLRSCRISALLIFLSFLENITSSSPFETVKLLQELAQQA